MVRQHGWYINREDRVHCRYTVRNCVALRLYTTKNGSSRNVGAITVSSGEIGSSSLATVVTAGLGTHCPANLQAQQRDFSNLSCPQHQPCY